MARSLNVTEAVAQASWQTLVTKYGLAHTNTTLNVDDRMDASERNILFAALRGIDGADNVSNALLLCELEV